MNYWKSKTSTKDCGFYALTVTGAALVLHNRWCDHIFCPSATLRLLFQCSWCALTFLELLKSVLGPESIKILVSLDGTDYYKDTGV